MTGPIDDEVEGDFLENLKTVLGVDPDDLDDEEEPEQEA